MNDIFISYSRKDSNVVSEFVWRFELEGFKVWIDKEGIYSGDEFAEVLATAIEESTVVVYFSSVNSNASKWTSGEIGIADMYDKHIIPVRLDLSPYNKKTIIHLVNRDYIDYSNPARHSEMMERLINVLRVLCPNAKAGPLLTKCDIELFVQEHDGDMGYVDNKGDIVIPFIYEEAEKFYDGLARVCRGGHWGFINKAGTEVVPLIYNYIELFSEDYALFVVNNRFGFVDKSGREVISPIFDNANSFSGGLAAVEQKDLWGFINKQGHFVIPLQYSQADDFSEGYAAVMAGGKWGYVNQMGQVVIPLIYDEAFKVHNGTANVLNENVWNRIIF